MQLRSNQTIGFMTLRFHKPQIIM